MSDTSKIQLRTSCIKNVPLQTYCDDFTMIVNGEEFKMSRLMSDLLSPNICKIHINDPTFNQITINTQHKGDFQQFLRLINFDEINIADNEIEFIIEIIEKLGTNSIEITETSKPTEITLENVFSLLKTHEQFPHFFSRQLFDEIEFVSAHFYEICEEHFEDLRSFSIQTLARIVGNEKLKLHDEDELLNFVNNLYKSDSQFCEIYESVIFKNTTSKSMKNFVEIFDFSDLSTSMWSSIASRLQEDVVCENVYENRYTNLGKNKKFEKKQEEEFNGILNHIVKTSQNDITITSSSLYLSHEARNVILFNDQSKYFMSQNHQDGWICFDFHDNRVTPTDYTIRSPTNWGDNSPEPQNWVIEGSNDNSSFDLLSEEKDCKVIHGKGKIHTFKIRNQSPKEYRYIRLRQTGKNGHGNDYLIMDSFELYGNLIESNKKQ